MATETKPATEDVKIDLFEDDDEFEEFEINGGSYPFPSWFLIIKVLIPKKYVLLLDFFFIAPSCHAWIFIRRRKFVLTLKKGSNFG